MSTTVDIHAKEGITYAHAHPCADVFSLSLEVDHAHDVTVFLEFEQLTAAADYLQRSAEALRALAITERNRRLAESAKRLRASLQPTVREYLAEVDADIERDDYPTAILEEV
jgi:hypothetical protein